MKKNSKLSSILVHHTELCQIHIFLCEQIENAHKL